MGNRRYDYKPGDPITWQMGRRIGDKGHAHIPPSHGEVYKCTEWGFLCCVEGKPRTTFDWVAGEHVPFLCSVPFESIYLPRDQWIIDRKELLDYYKKNGADMRVRHPEAH